MESQAWDAEAATFDREPDHGLLDPLVRDAWEDLVVPLMPAAPASVLDVGCGTGSLSVLLAQSGYEEERFLRLLYVTTYAVLAIGTLIYQGLMTAYYVRRRRAIETALQAESAIERFN